MQDNYYTYVDEMIDDVYRYQERANDLMSHTTVAIVDDEQCLKGIRVIKHNIEFYGDSEVTNFWIDTGFLKPCIEDTDRVKMIKNSFSTPKDHSILDAAALRPANW
jgi:hypothetical protein